MLSQSPCSTRGQDITTEVLAQIIGREWLAGLTSLLTALIRRGDASLAEIGFHLRERFGPATP